MRLGVSGDGRGGARGVAESMNANVTETETSAARAVPSPIYVGK